MNKEISTILQLIQTNNIDVNFNIIDPVGYFDILRLLEGCTGVVTDSGGLVRESYFYDKPSIFLMENHVWPELDNAGCSFSTKINKNSILDAYKSFLDPKRDYEKNIFGYGNAGQKILETIKEFLL